MATSPQCLQTSQVGRPATLPLNAYAPWVPSPLNPNPRAHASSSRTTRRIIRRVSKPAVTLSSGTTSSSSKPARPPTTIQRILRRKAEAAIREHKAYQNIKQNSIREREQRERHRSEQQRASCARMRGWRGAATGDNDDDNGTAAGPDAKTPLLVDEWSLDLDNVHGMEEMDLGFLELAVGSGGWQAVSGGGSGHKMNGNSKHRQASSAVDQDEKRQSGLVCVWRRRPTRGVFLAAALLCLCGFPALRGKMPLRTIEGFSLGV